MHMKVVNETKPRRIINLSTSKSRNKRLKTTTKMLDVSVCLISGKNGWRLSRLIFKFLVLNSDSQIRTRKT